MPTANDLLTHPTARRPALARDAAAALAANGWRITHAARYSGGTADVAADRSWSRGRLTARVRLVIRCDSRDQRLVFSSLEDSTDRLPFYSFGDDDPAQRRALSRLFDGEPSPGLRPPSPALRERVDDDTLISELHAAAYPRETALTEPARIDAPRARTRVAALADAVLDEAFASIDAVRRDLLQHDLDVIGDDLDIDRDFAAQAAIDAAHRCELIYPIVITDAELWALPRKQRRDWLRIERASLVGHERQWIDIVEATGFASYAEALTRHLSAAYRKRRFAPAGASSRS